MAVFVQLGFELRNSFADGLVSGTPVEEVRPPTNSMQSTTAYLWDDSSRRLGHQLWTMRGVFVTLSPLLTPAAAPPLTNEPTDCN